MENHYKCEICEREFYLKPYSASKLKRQRFSCSKECNGKLKSKIFMEELILKVEEVSGMDANEYLKRRYSEDFKSIRFIAFEIFGNDNNSRSINLLLKHFGIKIRNRSESVKAQWINNQERREQTAERMKKNTGEGTPGREKLKKLMTTEEYKKKSSASKQGVKNPMYGVTGEKNPLWKPDLSQEVRITRRGVIENTRWRKAVLLRDQNVCQKCKGEGKVVHHMDSYTKFPERRFDVDNGIVLCEDCHIKYHSIAGMNSTKEKTIAFLNQ